MFPAFVPIVAWITLVAVLITIWWLRRRRDQETMRAFAAPKPPPAIPGSPPRCVEVETDSGTIRVTHLVFSSDVPEGGGEREMQAGWDFAAANKAYRILIDLPPFGGSSRRFFQASSSPDSARDRAMACLSSGTSRQCQAAQTGLPSPTMACPTT